jgi:hypothetical protein
MSGWRPCTVIVALAAFGSVLVACGTAATNEVATKEAPATAGAAPSPGPQAALKERALPAGWRFIGERRPRTEHGNAFIVRQFEGPEVAVRNPGGPTARLKVVVTAANIPGIAKTGEANDLTALALRAMPPEANWKVDESSPINGRKAVVMRRPVGDSSQIMIVVTVGDWKISISGTSVDLDLMQNFAKAVDLQ